MPELAVPEGYLPYRLFTFQNEEGEIEVALRPEQVIGIGKSARKMDVNFHASRPYWVVDITTKDGSGPMQVSFNDKDRCCRFVRDLTEFLEQDALRNTHNAVMRKGKTNG
jgi:hypothetical protein